MLLKDNNPWLGLESYSTDDASRFFGRDSDVDVVSNAIYDNFITTIYGISGAGKTSLLNAGLTPELLSHNFLPIRIRLKHNFSTSYETQIIDSIWSAIESIGGEVEYEGKITFYDIPENERLWFFFHTHRFWSDRNYPIRPVIFIDQFEEIFTQNDDTEVVSEFFNSINAIQYDTPPSAIKDIFDSRSVYQELTSNSSRIVFVIREDFLARLEDYSYSIASFRRNRIGVKRMNGIQALEVIINPISGLVTREGAIKILSKVSGKSVNDSQYHLDRLSIDTSILSLFCSELYQRACEEGSETISERIIDEFGNDIISQFYQDNMSKVSLGVVEYIERHLLTSSGFRNSVALEDIEIKNLSREEIMSSLSYLAGKRILRIEESEGVERVEFTHDVLCKVAKQHRDSRKEEQIKNKDKRKSFFKIVDFVALLAISLYIIFVAGRMTDVFASEWLSVMILFAYVFLDKNTNSGNIWKMISAVAITAILLNPLAIIFGNKDPWLSIIAFIFSIILSYYSFLAHSDKQQKHRRLLMTLIIFLGVMYSGSAFAGTLVLISLLVLTPYSYSGDKNSTFLCYIATIILAICMVITETPLLILAFYPLLRVFSKKESSSKSFKESLQASLRCEFYKEHPTERKILLGIMSIILLMQTAKYGTALSDTFVLYTPFLSALIFYVFFELLLSDKFSPLIDNDRKVVLFKGSVISGCISLLVVLCQYVTYGYIYMILIWGGFLVISYRRFIGKEKYKGKVIYKYLGFFILILSVIFTPLHCMGYNVFKNGQYAKVPLVNLPFSELIVIRDGKGNYGVRDRYNIVVPVKYSDDITVHEQNITYSAFKRPMFGSRYSSVSSRENYHTFNPPLIIHHSSGSSSNGIPSIVFSLKDKSTGDRITWDCTDHLNNDNICSSLIIESAKRIMLSEEFDPNTAHECSRILESAGESVSKYAKNQVLNSLRRYLSADYQIQSFYDIDRTLDIIKENMLKFNPDNIYIAVNSSKHLFRFIDDQRFTTFVMDTLYRLSLSPAAKSYEKWEFYTDVAECYLSSGMYMRAIEYADMAIAQDTSLKYADRIKAEAYVIAGEYELAFQLLEQYGDEMYYQGKIYSEITETEERILYNQSDSTSVLLRYDNIHNSVVNSLRDYESWGMIPSTVNPMYVALKEYISQNPIVGTYDSAEDRGSYYLCRKYKDYMGPRSEISNNRPIRDEDVLEYQFYWLKDGTVLPRFKRYAEGFDEDILLIIDEDTHQRRYIDRSDSEPKIIEGEFSHAWRFSEGLAAVVVDNKVGFINKEGEYVIEPIFDYRYIEPKSSERGRYYRWKYSLPSAYAPDLVFKGGLCPMSSKSGTWGIINKEGQWVLEPKYDDVFYHPEMKLWLIERRDNDKLLYGAMGLDGQMLMEVEYEQILYSSDATSLWGREDYYWDIRYPTLVLSLIERNGDSFWFNDSRQGLQVYDDMKKFVGEF